MYAVLACVSRGADALGRASGSLAGAGTPRERALLGSARVRLGRERRTRERRPSALDERGEAVAHGGDDAHLAERVAAQLG